MGQVLTLLVQLRNSCKPSLQSIESCYQSRHMEGMKEDVITLDSHEGLMIEKSQQKPPQENHSTVLVSHRVSLAPHRDRTPQKASQARQHLPNVLLQAHQSRDSTRVLGCL